MSMLDRAKILFGAGQNFAHITHQAVAIFAVRAVKLLDKVEITQVMTIENHVIRAFDLGDAVNRKAGELVKADEQVKQHHRENHAVDDGACDQVLRAVGDQPAEEIVL